MQISPWGEVAIDRIGLWTVKVHNRKVELNALTCIDTASNLVELIRIDNKTSHHIVHDKGGEFIGGTFQWLLHSFDIKDVQSAAKIHN